MVQILQAIVSMMTALVKFFVTTKKSNQGHGSGFSFYHLNQTDVENKFALKSGTTGYRNFCSENEGNITCDKNYLDDQGTTFQYYILQKESNQDNNIVDLAKISETILGKNYQGEISPGIFLSQDTTGASTEANQASDAAELANNLKAQHNQLGCNTSS